LTPRRGDPPGGLYIPYRGCDLGAEGGIGIGKN